MEKLVDKKRRSSHQTQWAAQFAVASELCKIGYQVALTMGNHPTADMMVYSPEGTAFVIDVKGLYKRNFWAVRRKPEKSDVFYVFAFVPAGSANRYFVMTQSEVNAGIDAEFARAQIAAAAKGRDSNWVDKFPGVSWTYAEKFDGGWDKLPA
ncbi:hypothetical protein ACT9ST_08410 [Sphingobium limneticum]